MAYGGLVGLKLTPVFEVPVPCLLSLVLVPDFSIDKSGITSCPPTCVSLTPLPSWLLVEQAPLQKLLISFMSIQRPSTGRSWRKAETWQRKKWDYQWAQSYSPVEYLLIRVTSSQLTWFCQYWWVSKFIKSVKAVNPGHTFPMNTFPFSSCSDRNHHISTHER